MQRQEKTISQRGGGKNSLSHFFWTGDLIQSNKDSPELFYQPQFQQALWIGAFSFCICGKTRDLFRFACMYSQPNCPHVVLHHVESHYNNPNYHHRFTKVNGCELPGGSVLRVEPSDPYYKVAAKTSKSDSDSQTEQQQSPATAVGMGENASGGGTTEDLCDPTTGNTTEKQLEESGGGGADSEEDLDGFFASLE